MRPPKEIVRALSETGLPYKFQMGTRHLQIRVCDRMVGILPRHGKALEGRAMRNVIAQIRRVAKELTQ